MKLSEDGQMVNQFVPIDSIEPLLVNEHFDLSVLAWVLGGAALAGVAAGGGGGGGNGNDALQDTSGPGAPTVVVRQNADGGVTIVGSAEAGSTVLVTYPDGTSSRVVAGVDGSFSVTSGPSQPTGNITASVTDVAGNSSPDTVVAYTDITAPTPPTASVVTNADGSVTVTGSTEPGNTVSITYPDGSTATVVAGTDGLYSATSAADQPTGDITVNATDAAGNVGADTVVAYSDTTVPQAPTVTVTTGTDGSVTVTGLC